MLLKLVFCKRYPTGQVMTIQLFESLRAGFDREDMETHQEHFILPGAVAALGLKVLYTFHKPGL